MAKFSKGDRVVLIATPEFPFEERGKVLDYEGDDMYMVEVDQDDRKDPDGNPDPTDDGLRECSEDQMRPEEH